MNSFVFPAPISHLRNHIRMHLLEPQSRADELHGILTTSLYVRLMDVEVIQERFYRQQINGVVYFRPKYEPKVFYTETGRVFYRFEVGFWFFFS